MPENGIPLQKGFIMQSRKHSAIEAIQNIIVGIGVAYISNMVILPAVLGVHLSSGHNVTITAFFTAISFIRSYSLRRFNNWLLVNQGRFKRNNYLLIGKARFFAD